MSAYERLRECVASEGWLGEGEERLPLEVELQSRWMSGEFGREFVTVEGQRVVVRDFGEWNRGAGPDFLRAGVEVDGELRVGGVELDREVLDWERHGHGEDENFEEVVLHVSFSVLRVDFFVKTLGRRYVPRVEISREKWEEVVRLPLRERARTLVGRCVQPLAGMSGGAIRGLLDEAWAWRLREKRRAWCASVAVVGEEQALFQQVAEALGYRANRWAFRCLAQRLSLVELRRNRDREAILWGSSGFLQPDWGERAEVTAREKWRDLWDVWWRYRGEWESGRELPWKFHGARPANHPHRRLAALVVILGRWREWMDLLRRQAGDVDVVLGFFGSLEDEFWSYRHSWGSKRSERRIALVGDSHARQLVANVWAPWYVEKFGKLPEMSRELRGGGMNDSLVRVAVRLFGSEVCARPWLRSLWDQQALLQIYRDFCLEDVSECEGCPFPEQLAQWRGDG